MAKRIAIMGAGAVGSYVGAFLTREGNDVTLIDSWGQHVDAMKAGGLQVSGTQGEFTTTVKALHLGEVQQVREPFDIVFLSVKSYDTEWAAHFARRFLALEGFMLSAQNGWNDPIVASAAGQERTVGLVMSGISVALWTPGRVERAGKALRRENGHDVFRVGELDGSQTARAEDLARLLASIDGARVTTNLPGERWAKLVQNSMGNPVGAITGLGAGPAMVDERARELTIRLARETCQIGLAQGLKVEQVQGVAAETWAAADRSDVFAGLDSHLAGRASDNTFKNSMAQDVTKGRPTEIDELNGLVAARAREMGLQAPVTDATVSVMHQIEAGSLPVAQSNAALTLERAGFA